MELLFGIQINPETVTTVTLNDVNLNTKVKELKRKAAKRCNLPNDSLGKMTWHYLKISLCQSLCLHSARKAAHCTLSD